MCCAAKISKLLLFIFNIVFFLFGAGSLALGIFLIVDKDYLLGILGNIPSSNNFNVDTVLNTTSYLENGAYVLIGVGAFIFFVAFCGLCGGMRESLCLLYTYAVCVGLILTCQIAAGVFCYFYSSMVQTYLLTWMNTLVTDYYYGATMSGDVMAQSADDTGISDAIDYAQISLSCCGISNYTDYANANMWAGTYNYTSDGATVQVTNALVPITCCKMTNPNAWPGSISTITFVDIGACLISATSESTHLNSCYGTVLTLLHQYSRYAIYVGICIGGIECLGVLAAVFLRRQINSRKVRRYESRARFDSGYYDRPRRRRTDDDDDRY